MATSLVWVKAQRGYHDLAPEKLPIFCTTLKNQFATDPDVPASSITGPLTLTIFGAQISDVNAALLTRQSNKAKSITTDENNKVGALNHSADTLVNQIENIANQKYPGNIAAITEVYNRFGLVPAEHGKGKKHVFRFKEKGVGYAVIETPSAKKGAIYHLRWSIDQKTWIILKSKNKSIVKVNNLPHDTRVYFQFDVSYPAARGKVPEVDANAADFAWSDTISDLIPGLRSSSTGINTSNTPTQGEMA
jgi:hypothetical protein